MKPKIRNILQNHLHSKFFKNIIDRERNSRETVPD